MGAPHFFKCQERAERKSIFFALSVRAFFFSAPRVEECSTWDKMLHSSLSLSSQPTNQSGGGVGLLTVLRPNNNGEVNAACLPELDRNCQTTLILLWKIMLEETFLLRRVCHVSNHSNHSISTEKKTLHSLALTAERFEQSAWHFQLAKNTLMDTRP